MLFRHLIKRVLITDSLLTIANQISSRYRRNYLILYRKQNYQQLVDKRLIVESLQSILYQQLSKF